MHLEALETIDQIKAHLHRGDMVKVAAKSKKSLENVRKILKRPKAKAYPVVFQAAKEIAEYNQQLGL